MSVQRGAGAEWVSDKTALARPRRIGGAVATLALTLATASWAGSPEAPGPEAVRFFEAEVRPVLVQNCIKCHGPAKQKGGLRLDSKQAILAGGDSGPAIVPGKPEESLLVEAIGYDDLKMPPGGQLPAAQRTVLSRWIALGAPWPDDGPQRPSTTAAKPRITDEDRRFWSFQPVRRPDPPRVADGGWSRNPIDRFVRARLASAGLAPAPEADRRTLIRRLSFDLRGIPPEPEEVEAFLSDAAPDAYERLVDRFLASPRYGERWARHWLDLVRYAESDGYRQDAYRPEAWRYRDYVVQCLNDDVPYDRFITEQLAGDELDPDDPRLRVAVGFFRLGTYEFNQRNVPGQWSTILNEITDVAGDVFLGLGVACARCHDHKFDPILQRDYYRLQAFFTPILPRDDLELATDAERRDHEARRAVWEAETAAIRNEVAALETPYRNKAAQGAIGKFPEDIQAMIRKPRDQRTPLEHQLAELAYRQVTYEYDQMPTVMKKSKDRKPWAALQERLAQFDRDRPTPPPRVATITDVGPEAPPTVIPGDRARRPIEPGFLTLLDPEPAEVERPASAPGSTGRRSALARWLTRPDHPLTARVAVNRVWQYHFGRGLVGTSSDFGRLGERPSHPELLDWLASEFVARGWSLKQIHRLILTSAVYRQSARHPEPRAGRNIDPENRLLWHMPSRRLEVEPIRDAMLAASGELDPTMGGPSASAKAPRRTLYTKQVRNTHDPLSEAFDAPDGSITTPQRNLTVTPIQSLLLINGSWTLARARAFAARVGAAASEDAGRVDAAYRLAFGRPPEPDEQADAVAFLADQAARASIRAPERPASEAAAAALVDFCHALFNASEFLYVD